MNIPFPIWQALTTARDVLLFRFEMGGYVPEDVLFAIHKIDAALGDPPTPLICVNVSRATPEGSNP